jgi:hypothetical protein
MRAFFFGLLLLLGFAKASLAAAHPPYGLAADPAGNVYFSDLEAVWRLTPDGRLSIFRPAVPGRHVHALALAPDGAAEGDQNHYDPETQRFYTGLWRRTLAGAERDIVPMTDRPPPGAGIWRDEAGNRYVTQWISSSDRRTVLLRRRPDGGVDVLFDEAGGAARPAAPSVESVGGMAFGRDGSLFFADRRLLRRLARNGTVTTVYEGGAQSSLRGLAMAPDGRVLAADMGAKAVLALAADGTAETLYRESDGWAPTGGRVGRREAARAGGQCRSLRTRGSRSCHRGEGRPRRRDRPACAPAGRKNGAAAVAASSATRWARHRRPPHRGPDGFSVSFRCVAVPLPP